MLFLPGSRLPVPGPSQYRSPPPSPNRLCRDMLLRITRPPLVMKRPFWLHATAGALAFLALSAAAQQPAASPTLSPSARAAADSGRPPYTQADVAFMTGMIGHHAQAVLIAGWAPSHGASSQVQVLCERIVVAQNDEIATMEGWLKARKLPVPDPGAMQHMMMPGMDHGALMPGMLTPTQMAQLDSARGPAFDRLFLTFMIQHHQGALTMVDQLFNAPGAMQDDVMYKFAADVSADQSTEIERMTKMLAAMPAAAKAP